MNKYKTLIILDWDDTLFPTSWIVKNNINLSDKKVQNQYIVYFSKLDMILYNMLTKLLKYGSVFIVTNAVIKWVHISSTILPNTQKLINNNIIILSARETFQNKYPDQMWMWKKLMFKQLIENYYNNYKFQNIVSVGDAEHEFNATVDLYNEHSIVKNRLLKTIRFVRDPSFESLIDQLEVLDKSIHNIIINIKHYDLTFKDK
ncbi:HAD-like superfamily protein [Fadolivirus algeromassiliense]|jgi:hypothetical protein|uniref:HAD-like superfamily protein n=1 Tax=Fadolivirus FV1/VV64 TaxID=3070911 RepID=A0A7D3QWI0_9VIRU|nr:HAD-like superfamily protein [Fadolivirus algeromassiliense]QKF93620.1 HAD-like superfamily protein [Fadolivirus FV1/VV64]